MALWQNNGKKPHEKGHTMAQNYWGDELPSRVDLPPAADPARPGYGRIDFDKLPNTRDLGGMVGAGGRRVKHGLLLRSGTLGFGSPTDIDRLRDDYDLRLVVDFRNLIELSELPDPMDLIAGARYLHAEIFSDRQVGVTQEHEKTAFEYKLESMAQGDPVEFMTLLYPHMLIDETGINGYRSFVRAVLDVEEGAALWHCYVGRDRCGMGSALIETMLGVSRNDILADYLATNLYAPIDLTLDSPASICYFEAMERALEPHGGFMGYLTGTLGITEDEIAAFRERCLED